ncbi:hypothetical protein FQA39_LY10184 [Lamprigera yunnana]|nr:hypothetical protein FQA39_LY10184 [Lamprigera yunnana]
MFQYGPVYSRSSTDSKSSDRSSVSRLEQKYGSYNSAHYCDSDKYSGTTRLKEAEKKELTQPPPVSYRSISRTGTRSRDPSMERDNSDRVSSLAIHNCNSLYPPSIHTRSASHERSEPSSINSTIPKYTGRSSITKNDKFGLSRTSRNESKEDLKSLSRATSREDLDSGPKKYITSRFLPKNTIEKSHTAYIRPSSSRISSSQRDTSRKNREILNLLSTHSDTSKSSRPASRCSNVSDSSPKSSILVDKTSISSKTNSSDVTKSSKQTSEDNTKSSKTSNMSATPWSSYLDLRFTSPKSSKSSNSSQPPPLKSSSNSANKLSTPSSTKFSQPDSKSKLTRSSAQSSAKALLNKDFRKSVLNMNLGMRSKNSQMSPAESDTEATDVSENLSSCVSYHKPSPSSSSASKLPKRSNGESVDRRRSNTRSPSLPSESHSSSAAVTSGSEDDAKIKSTTSKSEVKKSKLFLSSRCIVSNEHGDGSEKAPKPPMSPRQKNETEGKSLLMKTLSPITGGFKIKQQDSDTRVNWMDSTDKDTSSIPSKANKPKDEAKIENTPKIKIMRRVDSGERAWWLDGNVTPPEGVQVYKETFQPAQEEENQNSYFQKYRIRHIDSGEKPWWFNSSENEAEVSTQSKSMKSEPKYQIRHQKSGEKAWWLQTPPKSNAHSSETSESDLDETQNLPLGDRASPEGLEMPKEEETSYLKAKKPSSLFISKHKNIDDILGGASQCLSPLMEHIFNYQGRNQFEECQEVRASQVKIHDSTPQHGVIHPNRL